MARPLDLALGALNGAVGDYLVRTNNPLATRMRLVQNGASLPAEREAIAGAHEQLTSRAVVLVHGLMCTEDVFRFPDGSDYGSLLSRDLGVCPYYVRYNSGLPIAETGAQLAQLLEALTVAYPIGLEELIVVGYSMGGLVVRSACHVGAAKGHAWLRRVQRAIYVGTPHLGAPLERYVRTLTSLLKNIDDPYAQIAADIADLRSDGIRDLGDADLRHEDRANWRASVRLRDPRHPVPLLPQLRHYLVAGTVSRDPQLVELFGDALVPVESATAGNTCPKTHAFAPGHVRVFPEVSHVSLARHMDVYDQIRTWCEEQPT
ncbi:MAG: alpha/beta fold hydrolase [Polyangiaceae bacterium]|nr:alpha/beta fold hydrolase [Polyangiaceae bacterium]